MTLSTLNLGNYGTILYYGHAGFSVSTVDLSAGFFRLACSEVAHARNGLEVPWKETKNLKPRQPEISYWFLVGNKGIWHIGIIYAVYTLIPY